MTCRTKKKCFAFFRLLTRRISYDMFKGKSLRMAQNKESRFRIHMIVIAERKKERLNYLFSCSCRTQKNVRIERVKQNRKDKVYIMINERRDMRVLQSW